MSLMGRKTVAVAAVSATALGLAGLYFCNGTKGPVGPIQGPDVTNPKALHPDRHLGKVHGDSFDVRTVAGIQLVVVTDANGAKMAEVEYRPPAPNSTAKPNFEAKKTGSLDDTALYQVEIDGTSYNYIRDIDRSSLLPINGTKQGK